MQIAEFSADIVLFAAVAIITFCCSTSKLFVAQRTSSKLAIAHVNCCWPMHAWAVIVFSLHWEIRSPNIRKVIDNVKWANGSLSDRRMAEIHFRCVA